MFRYAKLSDYPGEFEHPVLTKRYQERFLADVLPRYCGAGARVLEVGANTNVTVLSGLEAEEKWIADPYIGIGGSKRTEVPDLGPGYVISRCIIGESSNALPSDYFDVIFSSSVLEHIGQEAAGYDCRYTAAPPEGQEAPRRAFCEECFRLLRPGGVTVHGIDHGVRNVSYDANFLGAGFRPLVEGERVDVGSMMADADALRQTVTWDRRRMPLAPEQAKLHSVLLAGYVKPEGAARRWARLPRREAAAPNTEAARQAGSEPVPCPTIVARAIARARRVAGRTAR